MKNDKNIESAKANSKLIKIVFLLVIMSILAIVILFLTDKNYNINLIKRIQSIGKQTTENGTTITPYVYDNATEELKTIIEIKNDIGIEQINYINNEGEEIILYCNNKTAINIDRITKIDEEYQFEVIVQGNKNIEVLRMEEDKYHKYLDDVTNIEIAETTEQLKRFTINFKPVAEEISYFYKIGPTREWVNYTDTITLNYSDIDINDIIRGTAKVPIYAKQVDKAGNTLINKIEFDTPTDLTYKCDVFNDVKVRNQGNLQEYGFTAYNSSPDSAFSVGNFQAGHSAGAGSWAGTFRLNDLKYKAKSIAVNIYTYASGGGTTAYGTLSIVYNDGTADSQQVTGNGNHLITINFQDKDINYIQIYLNGNDKHWENSYASVTSIVLYGIEIPINN